MKVCFVSSYPPNHARLSEYAQNLVNALSKSPSIDKIYLLGDTAEGAKKEKFAENSKVEVLRIWTPDKPLSIIAMLKTILKLKPDIIHFNVHYQSYGKSRLANFAVSPLFFCQEYLVLKRWCFCII